MLNNSKVLPNNKLLVALFSLLFLGSLINCKGFGPTTLAAYFFYTLSAAAIAIAAGVRFVKYKQPIQIPHPLPIICFGVLAAYYFLNGVINKDGGINLRHYIILIDALLLLSCSLLYDMRAVTLLTISKIVMIFVGIESIVCILQQFGVVPSMNDFFTVTGSNENPNVTAMFIAMALPALLLVVVNSQKWMAYLALAVIFLGVIVLILLKCRSACIGAACSVLLLLNYQYQLLSKWKKSISSLWMVLSGVAALGIGIGAFLWLYQSKQASSDGRWFIWKISLQAIAKQPILGSGYGQFEHDYNLAQAQYFASNNASAKEIDTASFVHMSYNEFVENLFEGGIIGLVLFAAILIAVLIIPCTTSNQLHENTQTDATSKKVATPIPLQGIPLVNEEPFAYFGIISFVVMSIFNFTVQAFPVRALFIIYTGVCCANSYRQPCPFFAPLHQFAQRITQQIFHNILLKTALVFCTLWLCIKLLSLAKAFHQCETLVASTNDLDKQEGLQEMDALKNTLNESTYYWWGYANMLVKNKYYGAAIKKYKEALRFSSNPNTYMDLGNCYAQLEKYPEAIQAYTLAANIEPHRFAPKFGLMKLYGYAKADILAEKMAAQIVYLKPKIASEEVAYYKEEANKLLDNQHKQAAR